MQVKWFITVKKQAPICMENKSNFKCKQTPKQNSNYMAEKDLVNKYTRVEWQSGSTKQAGNMNTRVSKVGNKILQAPNRPRANETPAKDDCNSVLKFTRGR